LETEAGAAPEDENLPLKWTVRRLREAGIKHLFGVPGDYNLAWVQQLEDRGDPAWIGNCNELNAAYATDGYARVNGLGVLTDAPQARMVFVEAVMDKYDAPVDLITGGHALADSDYGVPGPQSAANSQILLLPAPTAGGT